MVFRKGNWRIKEYGDYIIFNTLRRNIYVCA